MADNSVIAEAISGLGIVISAGLAAWSAVRNARDKGERRADRRGIEERTTDRILARVYAELDRAYEYIDEQEEALNLVRDWLWTNRKKFDECGIAPAPRLNVSRSNLREEVEAMRSRSTLREGLEDEEKGPGSTDGHEPGSGGTSASR